MHLALQIGYQIITYDARNHGLSEKSYTTLGRIEASDLQDVINYVRKRYRPKKIGLYGFSMGAATCLFWISKFASQRNSEVALVICEAPYDDFSKQLEFALGSGRNRY
jgi:alpha-beta hydrolase superfamily lysophospholipase